MALISYDQFPHIALLVSTVAAENSDPADLVTDAEEELANVYHFNLQGTVIMSNTIATQLNEIRSDIKVHRVIGTQYFDLLDYVDSNCHHPRMKQFITASLAGVFDMHIIALARNVYFKMFEQYKLDMTDSEIPSIDLFNTFKSIFTENLQGLDNQNSMFADLISCMSARALFHDEAAAAHIPSGTRPVYTVRDFDELMNNDREIVVGEDDAAKLRQLAAALSSPEYTKETLDLLITKEKNRIKSLREMGNSIAPALISIIAEAERSSANEVEFYDLPQTTQRMLIERVIEKLETALERLAGFREITTAEFASIIVTTKAAQRELKHVVATRWPDTVEERPTVAMTRAQRRQKAEAARITE